MMQQATTSFTRRCDCVTRRVAGETIIVPVRGHAADLEAIFTLNEVGSRIWDRLDGPARLGAIVEEICAEYDVAPAEAEADALVFLQALEGAGLITAC
jgi:hypothetical protein